jgi:hypothetical protein
MLEGRIYYLGVMSIQDAASAVDELSFMKVLDPSTMKVQITNMDRIQLAVGPASSDNDFSKGVMITIGGRFTSAEMNEIEGLGRLADTSVTNLVTEFVAKQAKQMVAQGLPGTHMILGQLTREKGPRASSARKWWNFWK